MIYFTHYRQINHGGGDPTGHQCRRPHTPTEDLCLDFVNSRFNDHRGTGSVYDRLPMAGWWSWLVSRWDLGPCPTPTEAELVQLRRLRRLTRRLLEADDPPDRGARAALDRVLAGSPMAWRLGREPGPPTIRLEPVSTGVAFVAAAIVVSLVEVIGRGDSRVRTCGNPHCSFLFRDTSHNGSRRWCDPAICGNLVKVRAFRAARATQT